MQLDLLTRGLPKSWADFDMPNAQVRLYRSFLGEAEATQLFHTLREGVPWTQDEILVYGRRVRIPRLHRWMSDPEQTYAWSGIEMDPLPWTPEVARLRDSLSEFLGVNFNGVLLNLYRDGADSVGWHSDNEAVFGDCPTIASVSLGHTRDFVLRHKTRSDLDPVKIALDHGSLLLMSGPTQTHWAHALPRRARVPSPRINLTFRRLVAPRG